MFNSSPRQSRRSSLIEERPFLQVCLYGAAGIEREKACANAKLVLQEIVRGTELPAPMRSQVPLFAHNCAQLGVLQASGAHKLLTALALREQRRNAIMTQERARILTACNDIGDGVTEIRGPMIGQTYYPAPDLRHTHALRFAVFDADPYNIVLRALFETGWQIVRDQQPKMDHMIRLGAASGTEMVLYSRLLPHTHYTPERTILGRVEFQVAAILCQTHFEHQERTKRWICDLSFIFAVESIDTDLVVGLLAAYGMAGSCAARLRDVLAILPGCEQSRPGQIAATLLQKLEALGGGKTRDSAAAKAALRDLAPPRRGKARRVLSALRRAVVSGIQRGRASYFFR